MDRYRTVTKEIGVLTFLIMVRLGLYPKTKVKFDKCDILQFVYVCVCCTVFHILEMIRLSIFHVDKLTEAKKFNFYKNAFYFFSEVQSPSQSIF